LVRKSNKKICVNPQYLRHLRAIYNNIQNNENNYQNPNFTQYSLLKAHRSNKMYKKFEHQFNGKIWNTAFGENVVVLEIRDENTRQVSFSAIDLQNGEILWQNLRPEKSWWLALVGVFDDYLVLHKYSSQQKPEPKGLLILNLLTGEIVQKIDDWIFFNYEVSQSTFFENLSTLNIPPTPLQRGISTNPISNLKVQKEEGLSGNIKNIDIKNYQQNIITLYQLDENNLPVYQEIILENLSKKSFKANLSQNSSPTHYPEDSPHFPAIFNFLYRLVGIEAQKGVDYLEIDNKIVISYYIYSNNLFQNYLLVITHDRQILLNDLIATTEGIGIDTFTLQSDTLLYVKNENYFVGYEL
jgi:Domain of unknown function (DUF4905)